MRGFRLAGLMYSVGQQIAIRAGTGAHKTLRETLKRLKMSLAVDVPATITRLDSSIHYPVYARPELDIWQKAGADMALMRQEIVI